MSGKAGLRALLLAVPGMMLAAPVYAVTTWAVSGQFTDTALVGGTFDFDGLHVTNILLQTGAGSGFIPQTYRYFSPDQGTTEVHFLSVPEPDVSPDARVLLLSLANPLPPSAQPGTTILGSGPVPGAEAFCSPANEGGCDLDLSRPGRFAVSLGVIAIANTGEPPAPIPLPGALALLAAALAGLAGVGALHRKRSGR